MKTRVSIYLRKNLLSIIGGAIGVIAGFFYWLLVGCSTGGCPITGNPYISSVYGGLLGWLLFSSFNKR
jgi:hypothetical protein